MSLLLLVMALGVLMLVLVTVVFQELFWWCMIGAGALMFAGVVVEVLWNWRQYRAEGRECPGETPKPALAATASSSALENQDRE